MKKKTIKTFSAALVATLAMGMTAGCNGNIASQDPSENENATLITVLHNTGSAASTQWWVEANKRFVDSKKDEVYETGTNGSHLGNAPRDGKPRSAGRDKRDHRQSCPYQAQ